MSKFEFMIGSAGLEQVVDKSTVRTEVVKFAPGDAVLILSRDTQVQIEKRIVERVTVSVTKDGVSVVYCYTESELYGDVSEIPVEDFTQIKESVDVEDTEEQIVDALSVDNDDMIFEDFERERAENRYPF
jgi:23S rRNA G2445 N2-methylase RlmL